MDLKTLYLVTLVVVAVDADCEYVIRRYENVFLDRSESKPLLKCNYVERFIENVYQDICHFSGNEEQTVIDLAQQALGDITCYPSLLELINEWRPNKENSYLQFFKVYNFYNEKNNNCIACMTDIKRCVPPEKDTDGFIKNKKSACNDLAKFFKCAMSHASCQIMYTAELKEKEANDAETILEKKGIKCPFKVLDLFDVKETGINKLKPDLKPNKASGPVYLPEKWLKELHNEIDPIFTTLFQAFVNQGSANVPKNTTLLITVSFLSLILKNYLVLY